MNNLNPRWRGLFVVVAVLVCAGFLLGACGSKSTSTKAGNEGTPKPGGVYNYALGANPVAIEPQQALESEGIQVAHQVFQGLMKYELQPDGGMKAVPCIADKVTTSPDLTTFTFTLKHGVMFQPPVNREVTAQDFVDSWNRVTDPNANSPVSYILAPIQGANDGGYQADPAKGLTGVKALDKYTLQVKLRYPFAEFVQTLGHTVAAVTPVDYIKKIGEKAWALKPVGTGPYMVEKWVPNQYIDLVKNPTYWDKNTAGYVDKIHMPIFTGAESTQTMFLEFEKGVLDYSDVPPGLVRKTLGMPQVTSGKWTAKMYPALAVNWVGMNMKDPVLGKNLALRQAICYSTDQASVCNIISEGVDVPATGIIPVGVPGYRPGQDPYPFDTQKAKDLVAGMGSVPTLNYWFNTDPQGEKNAEVLQAGWKAVGINVKLSNYEWATYLDKLSKGDQDQMFRMGWIADYPSMDNFTYPLFQSANSRVGSYTFYSNKNVDQLLQTARGTADDTQRHDLYAQAEKLILADAPVAPVFFYRDFRVSNTQRVGGYYHDPMGFTDMWKVWVK